MGPSRSATRTGAVAGVVLLLGCLVAACDPANSPTPEPTTASSASSATSESTTATASPTPSAEETHIAEAKQTLLDYNDALNRVFMSDYATWSAELPQYWGTPELTGAETSYYRGSFEDGETVEGTLVIDGLTVVEYVAEPEGREQVRLEACTDNSGIAYFAVDGSAIPKVGPTRYIDEYLLQNSGEGIWKIVDFTAHIDRPC